MTTHSSFSDPTLASLLASLDNQDFVLLETTRITRDDHHSLLFSNPVNRITLTGQGKADHFLREAKCWLDRGYFLAGWLGYEFGYLLEPVLAEKLCLDKNQIVADLGVFSAPATVDHFDAAEKQAACLPQQAPRPPLPGESAYSIRNLHFTLDKEDYLAAIAAIKTYITAGDTYQVNYTLKLLFDFNGDPAALYRDLRKNQSVAYGAYIQNGPQRILSFSPELFFRKKANICTVRPMKGTMRRGRTTAEDQQNRHFLQSDSKNLSENVMIVDLLRNDLGRLALPATVQVTSLFDVETYETLHQMTSTIHGELPDDVQLCDLFKALFPCGSVTGAPKIRTMEIIRELEHGARGVYTGAIGYLDPCGDAVFNVPIRTIVLEQDKGEMGIGSGIVYDSDGENEWQECRLKADFLTKPHEDFQLIETILWQSENGYWLLEEHLTRLQDSAAYFQFTCDRTQITAALDQLAQTLTAGNKNQRVRLLLTKDGIVTLSATACGQENTLAAGSSEELPKVRFSSARTDSHDTFLYHKTTRRNLYNQERKKAVNDGYYEVLFVNERGEVTEGAISSVFIKKGGVFYTPPLQCGLLPGVFRSYFMAVSPQEVIEKILFPADLADADAIYVANSVRGMIQVTV
ncbi:MAG: aminodeoxychorismate synthase component I [Proteobacteria bacterium]|nr:aminodeoxychorismate synthase component I [Pseudomonadota bacterium]MBU4298063.1 aminodeoxychorismate synthase component I [Pseudomonadota bacterium]MCG2746350.1 aminodeoxychorismate synthase component I [Desulfobulbaceae bacterium]